MATGESGEGVSAIVVSYFTGPLLARALDALGAQACVREIILIDNGNWAGAVEDAVAPLRGEGRPPITVLSGHGNVGFAAACNLGARQAAGDSLLFLNPDAILPPGAADALLGDARREERSAAQRGAAQPWLIAPRLINPDGTEQQGSRRDVLTPWRAFVEASRLYRLAPRHPYFRRFNLHGDPCPKALAEVPVISGACFLMRADAYWSIDGMDERYFLHVEDIDFCLRFSRAGGRVLFDPKVEVVHFKSSSRVNPLGVEARKTASVNLYFRSHFADVYPPLFLPVVAALLWANFFVRTVLRSLSDMLSAVGLRARRGGRAYRRARGLAAHRAGR